MRSPAHFADFGLTALISLSFGLALSLGACTPNSDHADPGRVSSQDIGAPIADQSRVDEAINDAVNRGVYPFLYVRVETL
ncbi:MAG: hypothetical protein AAGL18_06730 [Pseudomonadota bacterium]